MNSIDTLKLTQTILCCWLPGVGFGHEYYGGLSVKYIMDALEQELDRQLESRYLLKLALRYDVGE